MKGDHFAARRALSDPRASKTGPDEPAHLTKPRVPPPPAQRSFSARGRPGQSAPKNASPRSQPTSTPSSTPGRRPRVGQAHVAVVVLDPTELLQLVGVDAVAEPPGEPYGPPTAKRTSGQ